MKSVPTLDGARTHFAGKEGEFLLFVTAEDVERCQSVEWFADHRSAILDALDRFGAVFFRGFGPDSHMFEAIADTLCPRHMVFGGGVSPRQYVHGTVFTSNDAPAPLPIPQHHELSYHGSTPRYVFFYCEAAPESGGSTPLTDGRLSGRILSERFPEVMNDLEEKGVIFIRNYSAANFKSWQRTWRTTDRDELEQTLRNNDTEFEWRQDGLRTIQRRRAIVRDPISNEPVVFASLNIWRRRFVEQIEEVYEVDKASDDEWALPFNTLYGDGTPIPMDFVEAMEQVYADQMVKIPYQSTDFVVVNNFVSSHGKEPRPEGPRRVLVTMRDPLHHSQLGRVPASSR